MSHYYRVTEQCGCDYVLDSLIKLALLGLNEDMPKSYECLENFQRAHDQQIPVVRTKTDHGKTYAETTVGWKGANQHIWKSGFDRQLVVGWLDM